MFHLRMIEHMYYIAWCTTLRLEAARQEAADIADAGQRAARLAQLAVWLVDGPNASVRELTRRRAVAEGARISESTVTAFLREFEARQQGAARCNPITSRAGAFAQ